MPEPFEVDFETLRKQLIELIADERDPLANTANFVALLYDALPDINWLGVYVLRGDELVLGPFQGKPACIRLPIGRGVCGTAASAKESVLVRDVQEYPGHIACDPASRSEVVVPLLMERRVLGVLDVDSPSRGRFSERDREGLESLCAAFVGDLKSKDGGGSGFI